MNNSATSFGGGIFVACDKEVNISIQNVKVSNSVAKISGGGGVYARGLDNGL